MASPIINIAQQLTFAPTKLSEPGTLVSIGAKISGIPDSMENIVQISNNCQDNTMVLASDGTIYGSGFGTTTGFIDTMKWVSAGFFHTLAINQQGKVYAWGINYVGQTDIPKDLSNVIQVEAGNGFSVALKMDGTVSIWDYSSDSIFAAPKGLKDVVKIAIGDNQILALKKDSTVIAWGNGEMGQSSVPLNLKNVVDISAGRYHNLALLSNGHVTAWGSNDNGQSSVPEGLKNAVKISAGGYHNLALQADGKIVAWGSNDNDQCNVTSITGKVLDISAGTNTSFFILDNKETVLDIKKQTDYSNKVYYSNHKLHVNTTEGLTIGLSNLNGVPLLDAKVEQGQSEIDLSHLNQGIYLVKAQSLSGKSGYIKIFID